MTDLKENTLAQHVDKLDLNGPQKPTSYRTSIYLDEDMTDLLKSLAAYSGASTNAVVRAILRGFFDADERNAK